MRSKRLVLLFAIGISLGVHAASIDDYYADALQRYQAQELKAAVIQLKTGLQSDPTHLPSRLLLGKIYLEQGDGASAAKEFRRARDLGATREQWELGLGQGLLLQGRADELLEEIAVDADRAAAQQAAVLVMRGRALMVDRQLEKAYQAFSAAAELVPASAEPLTGLARVEQARKRNDDALRLLDQALERDPANAEALVAKAQIASDEGRRDEALGLYERALAIDPVNVDALLDQAGLKAQRGELDSAADDLDKLSRIRPGYVPTMYMRAVVAFKRGKLDDAQRDVDTVLRVFPAHTSSLVLRGVISFIRGENEIARQFLEQARSAGTNNVELNKLMASLYVSAGEYERVIALLGSEINSSQDIQVLALLGSAYMGAGRQDEAFRAYGRAIEIAPDVAQLRTQLGLSMVRTGEAEKGMQVLQSAVDVARDAVGPEIVLVMGYLNAGDRAAAKKAALALEQKYPENTQVLNLSGIVLLADTDVDAAQQRFEKVLALQPTSFHARINLARVALARDDKRRAEELFQEILASQPNHFDALIGLIALADDAGDTDQLRQHVERATRAHPLALQPRALLLDHYLRRQMTSAALQLGNELVLAFPGNPQLLHQLGQAQLQDRQFAEAARTFDRTVTLDPKQTASWVRLGQSLAALRNVKGARKALEQALSLDPAQIEAAGRLVTLDAAEGHFDAALKRAGDIVARNPEQAEGYRLRGVVLFQAGRLAEAGAPLRKAYEIEPTSGVALLLAQVRAAGGDREGAVAQLEDWLRRDPDDLEARHRLAELYIQTNRLDQSEAQYRAIVERQPQDFLALNNLAWVQHDLGSREASASARRAYEVAPDNPAVLDTYGWMLHRVDGNDDEALRVLQQALLVNPRDPEIQLHMATVLAQLGRAPEAVVMLRRLLKESPRAPQAAEAASLLQRLGSQ